MMSEAARAFAEREIGPIAAELDESERFPAELYAKLAKLGMFGITVPEEMGGVGADVGSYARVMEQLSRG
ncbi:MAG: acyl-CoA dehydrogenase family protein, partial [Hyphomicrobiales bacterium]|nr:acyl-CoA dehydrogenase family protein [Hyphomicrobiales bacterium]